MENLFELFERKKSNNDFVKICAPMVRYSKLSFRRLVRKYGCDLAFTPMILADTFVASNKARDVEFTTCPSDRPLVVQFAANKVDHNTVKMTNQDSSLSDVMVLGGEGQRLCDDNIKKCVHSSSHPLFQDMYP